MSTNIIFANLKSKSILCEAIESVRGLVKSDDVKYFDLFEFIQIRIAKGLLELQEDGRHFNSRLIYLITRHFLEIFNNLKKDDIIMKGFSIPLVDSQGDVIGDTLD